MSRLNPGALLTLGADGQELFDFGHAVEPRSAGGAAGTLDLVQERLDLALEQAPVERTHGVATRRTLHDLMLEQ